MPATERFHVAGIFMSNLKDERSIANRYVLSIFLFQ